MESFINPEEYLEEQRKKIEAEKEQGEEVPRAPRARRPPFLLDHAPLERWERDVLEVIREEAYYFVPQMQTKIMNEGWATLLALAAHDREDPRCQRRSSTTPTTPRASWRRAAGGSTRTSSASSSIATSKSAGTRASSARSGKSATTSTRRRTGTCASASGEKKIFEVRALYNDVTFIDEFLTPEFCREHKLFTLRLVEPQRALRDRDARVQGGEGEAPLPAHERRQPVHLRRGRQLREPRRAAPATRSPGRRPARRTTRRKSCGASLRVWKRPVSVHDGRRGQAGDAPLRRQGADDAAPAIVNEPRRRDERRWASSRATRPLAASGCRRTSGSAPRSASSRAPRRRTGSGRRARRRRPACKRAAGMALNGALIVEPDDAWGRTYVEHVEALARDARVPEAVRAACRAVLDAKPPGGRTSSSCGRHARTSHVLEAARDVDRACVGGGEEA